MNVIEAIKNRHSYRGKYKSVPIPKKDLIKIMEAGLAAPSGCNKQTTSLIAVDDPKILEKLRKVINPPVGETAPAMICVLTQRINAYRDKCFAVQDYSAAIENMLLASIELGYQSCWYEGHITDEDHIGHQMAKILNVPDAYELVCFLPIGIAETKPDVVKKKNFEERAWFNSFHAVEILDRGKNMIWLKPSEYKKQEYIELRLYSPKSEKILLNFNPLKISGEPDWNPSWEEWHCYHTPLRIYKQDYELLIDYFNRIYPTKDAFDGTPEPVFDVVNDNWIGRDDWFKVIYEIEQDLDIISDDKKAFFIGFLEWLKEALNYTSIIVVEGNL